MTSLTDSSTPWWLQVLCPHTRQEMKSTGVPSVRFIYSEVTRGYDQPPQDVAVRA